MMPEEDNPFSAWIDLYGRIEGAKRILYLPNKKTADFILKKSNIKLSGFEFAVDNPAYPSVAGAFIDLWTFTDEGTDEKTIELNGKIYKITSSETYDDVTVKYINGWIGTPALGLYLSRILREDDENVENPFNEFQIHETFIPDITYLSELYRKLGVKNFEEMRISGTGDWNIVWKDVKYRMSDFHPVEIEFYTKEGTEETIPVLWENSDMRTFYLQRLPTFVLEKLELIVAQNREVVPPSEWSRDSIQAIAHQNLYGKDLISLCNTSKQVNAKCNSNDQQLFKVRLMTEFGIDWNLEKHGFRTPRELYVQMHTFYEYVIVSPAGEVSHFAVADGQKVPKGNHTIVYFVPRKEMINGNRILILIVFPLVPDFSFYISYRVNENTQEVFELRTYESDALRELLEQRNLSLFSLFLAQVYAYTESNGTEQLFAENMSAEARKSMSEIVPNVKNPSLFIISSDYN